jgi:cytochrome c oxidase subunit I+III
VLAGALLLAAWGATLLARAANRAGRRAFVHLSLASGVLLASCGGVALLAGPRAAGLDPTTHAYAATVWVLVGWTAFHVAIGVLMQLYCVARELARRLDPVHDADLVNTALYWHFLFLTAAVTVGVVAGFPQLV